MQADGSASVTFSALVISFVAERSANATFTGTLVSTNAFTAKGVGYVSYGFVQPVVFIIT